MKRISRYLFFLIGLISMLGTSVATADAGPSSKTAWVEHEIQYHFPEAGEVWLVWGVDGWQKVPPEMRSVGTVIRDEVMHTPMRAEDDYFTAVLTIPAAAAIDYGFLTTKSYDGTPITAVWEGGVAPIAAAGGVTTIHSLRTLPLGPLKSLLADLRFRWRAMLALVISFLLVIGALTTGAYWPQQSRRRFFPRVDRQLVELTLVIVVFKIALFVIAYLALVVFDPANPEIVLFKKGSIEQLLTAFSHGDVQWYMGIANDGYEVRTFSTAQKANWAFYPLWPLVLRASDYLSLRMVTWGILLANVFSIAALIGIYKLISLDFDQKTALLATLLALSFPGAYFLMRPGPEALFLLLSVSTFYSGRKKHWVMAGGLGALAALTRLQGVLLLPPLLYQYYRHYQTSRHHQATAVAFLLIPAALLGHMVRLYFLTGNFFANIDIQTAWDHNQSYPFAAMVRFLNAPVMIDYYGWDLAPVTFIFVFGAVVLAVYAAFLWRKGEFPSDQLLLLGFNLYVVVARDSLNASLRYLVVIFPLMTALALALKHRKMLLGLIVFIFISMQVFYLLGLALGFNWAAT